MSSSTTHGVVHQFQDTLNSLVLGQHELVEHVTICLLCRGHGLLTGLPGLAKTRLVEMMAYLLNQSPKRVQFTPDLTPFDIIGGEVLKSDGQRTYLEFVPGPLFHPFLIADEINRASPRTQSALLEAMQERQVTVGGVTYPLPRPFLVFATQNPLEQEGTFPLPEAQLDRFLMELVVSYPSEETETRILDLVAGLQDWKPAPPAPLPHAHLLWDAREALQQIHVSDELKKAIVHVVRQTRPAHTDLSLVKNYLSYGASPRASQALYITMKGRALIQGREQADFDDLLVLMAPVLRHRLGLSLKARLEGMTVQDLLEQLKRDITF